MKKIFADLWGDEDLVSSFDGCGIFRPAENNKRWATNGGWFHFDQNGLDLPDKVCVQGLMNLFTSGPEDGGLILIPKSNLLFKSLFQKHELTIPGASNFVQVQHREIPELFHENTKLLKLCLNPGDFALWYSITAHCNHPAKFQGRTPDNPIRLRRLVAYICMTPTKLIKNDEIIEKKYKSLLNAQTTTHWPHYFVPSHIAFYDKKKESENTEKKPYSRRGTRAVTWTYPDIDLHRMQLVVGNERAAKHLERFQMESQP